MLNGVPYLQAKVQFAFYAAAFVLFVLGALVPADRLSRVPVVGKVNLIAGGLALAIAPSMYIYFKAGFHTGSFFH